MDILNLAQEIIHGKRLTREDDLSFFRDDGDGDLDECAHSDQRCKQAAKYKLLGL